MTDVKKNVELESNHSEAKTLRPWMFRHSDLTDAVSSAKRVGIKKLTNILNYLHFKGESLHVLLKHPRYSEGVLSVVHHEPCLGEKLICRCEQAYNDYKLEHYSFQYLVVFYKQTIILVPPEGVDLEEGGFVIKLPEESFVLSERHFSRLSCEGIKAELWQNGFQAEGKLVDFGAHSFRIHVQAAPTSSFHWFNSEAQATVRLFDDKDVFYSGNCRCEYQNMERNGRSIVLTPVQDQIEKFSLKTQRHPRLHSSPPLYAVFEHPFIKKLIRREIFDISASGFSIFDEPTEAVLMPGMIVPMLTINYGDVLKVLCKSQVIYQKEENERMRFGVAILDMDLRNLNALNKLLNNIPGASQGMTNEVDLDQLWEMLFESDFIYPEKYSHIQAYKKSFQEIYKKLYSGSSEVARHFVYQKNDRIYSHTSLIRAYDRTWMQHHSAARPEDGRPTGIIVFKKMLGYLYDMHRFPSANFDYYMSHFRPGNSGVERIFSEFAKEVANPGLCSMDRFAYSMYAKGSKTRQLNEGWSVRDCSPSDLFEFGLFYGHYSGGLLLNVLSLNNPSSEESLEKAFAAEGLIRSYKAFSLNYYGELKAILIKEESDSALNLSDLLNGFKIFVLDDELQSSIIFSAVEIISESGKDTLLPLMVYPAEYLSQKGLSSEKEYVLWILDAQIGGKFSKYLGKRYRIKITEERNER
jgi:hypothetical protein